MRRADTPEVRNFPRFLDQMPVPPNQATEGILIVVHNHPSGDPKPSRADIDMTRKVKDAAAAVNITLHDHVIVSRGGHVSFRSEGLL